MKIKKINNLEDKKEYNNLAKQYGNIFNSLDWLKNFGNNLEMFGIYENKKIIGGFYLYKEKKFALNVYRNPPFTPYVGPIFQKINENKKRKLISLTANFIDNLPYSVISFSLNKEINDTLPFFWKKFKVSVHYTYVINLQNSIENIFSKMTKNRKNDINKAIKDNLIIEKVNDFRVIKDLANETFLRQKKKINQVYLSRILFNFAKNTNSFAFVAMQKEKPIAMSFCLYDKDNAYYLLGGYDYRNKHHGAGALCLWKSIKYAQKLGLKKFDFEGSMVPQIEKYFRGFGGKLVPYYRINKAKLPLEIILKFFKRGLF
jgi:lipid II:glycine glycyltransferase (peptidoglycan interpeptide bridge formation enzyme)